MAAHKLVLSARFQVIYLLTVLLGYTSAYDGVCSPDIIGALQGVGGSDLLQPASNCVNNSDNDLNFPDSMAEFGEPAMVEGTADIARASVPVYDVRPAPGKGLGVFAKHHLKRGTPILIEKPAFSVPLPTEMFPGQGFKIEHMIASIEAGFESLSPDQKEEYLDLHEFHPSEGNSNPLMTIFTTNAYTMDDEHVGIFPKIARINHSCKPNTLNWWSVKTRRRIMYTSRDIEKDEEITVSYIPLLKTTMARQHRLKQYGFTCECSACKSTEGDKRRVRMSDALEYLEQKQFSPTKKLSIKEKRISKSVNLVNMLEAEGLPDYLAQAYHFAAVFNQQAGHLREAREWAMKELEMLQLAERGSEEALKAMEYLENLNT